MKKIFIKTVTILRKKVIKEFTVGTILAFTLCIIAVLTLLLANTHSHISDIIVASALAVAVLEMYNLKSIQSDFKKRN